MKFGRSGETRAFGLALGAALAWLLLQTAAFAQPMPADVSNRIGRAGVFIYRYTPEQYATRLEDKDVVWSNMPDSNQGGADRLRFPPGVFSGAYTAVDRVPANTQVAGRTRIITACGVPRGGGCTLDWFRQNHPRWIIYKADQVTPAWQFGNKNWIPLDISNPDVQAWIQTNVYAPLLAEGYQAISVDNVTPQNDFGEAGVCSIAPTTSCTADGGTWTQLYSGARYDDQRFMAARIAWARAITAFVHSKGRTTMGNVTYVPALKAASADLINAFDIWFDEPGFTGDAEPSGCSLSGPHATMGRKWEDKVDFITRLNGGRGPKGYVMENSICPFDSASRAATFDMVEMTVASYLMVKNSHTYLTMFFSNGKECGPAANCDDRPGASWPLSHLEHGPARGPFGVKGGVYHRAFARALALVNPGPGNLAYELGPETYYRSDCSKWSGSIRVPGHTGMVLLHDAPRHCAGR